MDNGLLVREQSLCGKEKPFGFLREQFSAAIDPMGQCKSRLSHHLLSNEPRNQGLSVRAYSDDDGASRSPPHQLFPRRSPPSFDPAPTSIGLFSFAALAQSHAPKPIDGRKSFTSRTVRCNSNTSTRRRAQRPKPPTAKAGGDRSARPQPSAMTSTLLQPLGRCTNAPLRRSRSR